MEGQKEDIETGIKDNHGTSTTRSRRQVVKPSIPNHNNKPKTNNFYFRLTNGLVSDSNYSRHHRKCNSSSGNSNNSGSSSAGDVKLHAQSSSGNNKHNNSKANDPDLQSVNGNDDDGAADEEPCDKMRCCATAPTRRSLIAIAIIAVGLAASTAFLAFGLQAAHQESKRRLEKDLAGLAWGLESALGEYNRAGLWVHQACTSLKSPDNNLVPRAAFREVYESLVANGLPFHGVQFVPNVTHAERPLFEAEARQYYAEHYPKLPTYSGFSGFVQDNSTALGLSLATRDEQPYYFPVHYVEPVLDNVGVLDFDTFSEDYPRWAVQTALETWQPVLTGRLRLIQEFDPSPDAYSVLLMHPGTPVSTDPERKPRDVSLLAIRFPALFQYIADQMHIKDAYSNHQMYIFDSTPDDSTIESPLFLGGVHIHGDETWQDHPEAQSLKNVTAFDVPPDETAGPPQNHPQYSPHYWQNPHHAEPSTYLTYLPSIELDELLTTSHHMVLTQIVEIGRRQWTVAAVAVDPRYATNATFAIMGATFMLLVGLCLSAWVFSSMKRAADIHKLKAEAAHQQAKLTLDHAKQAAAAERELNEFIAHEVRNPLSACMSALSFVQSAMMTYKLSDKATSIENKNDTNSTRQENCDDVDEADEATRQSILDDLHIMDSSLQFINELLRNMLDFQRASYHQLKVEKQPTDMLQDILEPVDAMLYRRGQKNSVEVLLECPRNLVVHTDKLRLKQIVLNLARNSAKFVEHGFIRLKVEIVCGKVQVWVEDSGPGIPRHKRQELFAKFQESLDSLSQGTGLGLSLCKILSRLLGGDVWLDESYSSGIEGRPGSRFVIDLNTPAMHLGQLDDGGDKDAEESATSSNGTPSTPQSDKGDSTSNRLCIGQGEVPTLGILSSEPVISNGHSHNHLLAGSSQVGTASGASMQNSNVVGTLPPKLTVLMVDDDTVLRKLFVRSIRRVAPDWDVHEAASGEAALRLVDQSGDPNSFDVVFMDHYMASTEKQLLGTEAIRALRAKGVTCKICGLSANDMRSDFYEAGADAFLCKPFPAAQDELRKVLRSVLYPNAS